MRALADGGGAAAAVQLAVLTVSFAADTAVRPCPDVRTLERDCGGARRSTVGNCLVCMGAKHAECTGAEADQFCSRGTKPAAAQLVVQMGSQVSLLDPLTGSLNPLANFGSDWPSTGSTGLGCNSTHCISIGSFATASRCIGVFEKAAPTRIRVVSLAGTASFSAPAFVDSAGEWQVMDYSGTLYRIDCTALSLERVAVASAFRPPYYYHGVPTLTHTLPADTRWCALGSVAAGQVQGCFDQSMSAVGSSQAVVGGYNTNVADCAVSGTAGRLVCAAYNGSHYGVVAFDTDSLPATAGELIGADPRTAYWAYGFGVEKFAVVVGGGPTSGVDLFVMLAQPNLGDKRHATLFVTKLDRATAELSTVSTAVQPALDDGNLAWAAFKTDDDPDLVPLSNTGYGRLVVDALAQPACSSVASDIRTAASKCVVSEDMPCTGVL